MLQETVMTLARACLIRIPLAILSFIYVKLLNSKLSFKQTVLARAAKQEVSLFNFNLRCCCFFSIGFVYISTYK